MNYSTQIDSPQPKVELATHDYVIAATEFIDSQHFSEIAFR